jgi:hypothetical protein
MRQAAELPPAFYVGVELHARIMFTHIFDQPGAALFANVGCRQIRREQRGVGLIEDVREYLPCVWFGAHVECVR